MQHAKLSVVQAPQPVSRRVMPFTAQQVGQALEALSYKDFKALGDTQLVPTHAIRALELLHMLGYASAARCGAGRAEDRCWGCPRCLPRLLLPAWTHRNGARLLAVLLNCMLPVCVLVVACTNCYAQGLCAVCAAASLSHQVSAVQVER